MKENQSIRISFFQKQPENGIERFEKISLKKRRENNEGIFLAQD